MKRYFNIDGYACKAKIEFDIIIEVAVQSLDYKVGTTPGLFLIKDDLDPQ